jgi:3-deoxy-manno-octulosonate cytidylyltransferase (CMP-KDO synthetase)
MNCFENKNTQIATLVKKIQRKEELEDVNIVKVVRGENGQAIYFSRQMIPFVRNQQQQEQLLRRYTFYKHVGIYAYNVQTLRLIAKLQPTPAEQAECLEQLRWLEHGFIIQTAVTTHDSVGIDTPEDLFKAIGRLDLTTSSDDICASGGGWLRKLRDLRDSLRKDDD